MLVAPCGASGINISQGNCLAPYHCCFLHSFDAGLVLSAGLYHLAPSSAVYTLTIVDPSILEVQREPGPDGTGCHGFLCKCLGALMKGPHNVVGDGLFGFLISLLLPVAAML